MLMREFIEKSHINSTLVKAVIKQLGGWDSFKESAIDISRHGIDGGFHGFIWTKDTVEFAERNRDAIAVLCESYATDLGTDAVDLVMSFNWLKGYFYASKPSAIGKCLYGKGQDSTILNALAWFAGEEVSRSYCDILENEGEM